MGANGAHSRCRARARCLTALPWPRFLPVVLLSPRAATLLVVLRGVYIHPYLSFLAAWYLCASAAANDVLVRARPGAAPRSVRPHPRDACSQGWVRILSSGSFKEYAMSALVEVVFVFGVGQAAIFVLPSWLVGAIMCVYPRPHATRPAAPPSPLHRL